MIVYFLVLRNNHLPDENLQYAVACHVYEIANPARLIIHLFLNLTGKLSSLLELSINVEEPFFVIKKRKVDGKIGIKKD